MKEFLTYTVGPWIQFFISWGFILLFSILMIVLSFRGERWLVQRKKRLKFLWVLPFPALLTGLLYGSLRFSGRLVYPTDGWDTSAAVWWNYTNQNQGASILYICEGLMIGAFLAVCRSKASRAGNN